MLSLNECEVIQKRIEDYNREDIAITYWVDSLAEDTNEYHDLGRVELLVIDKIQQLEQMNNNNQMIEKLRKIKGKIDIRVLRGY